MKKKIVNKRKCIHDDYEAMMNIFVFHIMELDGKIWKRCAIEGCRYGYAPIDKDIADKCIYCGEPRNKYFDEMGPLLSIQKTLRKYKIKQI